VAMRTRQHMWRLARVSEDEHFKRYVKDRNTRLGYEPIESLRRVRLRFHLLSYLYTNSMLARMPKCDLLDT
jgi:hypothetical protein